MKSSTYVWIILAILAGIAVGYGISQLVGSSATNTNTTINTNTTNTNSSTNSNTANTNTSTNGNTNTNTSTAKPSIYLVALNDAGAQGTKIGCDDSMVPVTVTANNDVRGALTALFNYNPSTSGQTDLTNFIRTLNLSIGSIQTVGTEMRIALTGTISFGGVCDGPRLTEPLKATVAPFLEGKTAVITINGKTLQEITSLK